MASQSDPASSAAQGPRALIRRFRERYREVGLSVILALQASIMFVVSPLAGTGWISADVTNALRFGLAATAILIVNRSRLIGVLVGLTFVVSFVGVTYVKAGAAGQATFLASIGCTIAFDLAVAWTVAHAAFDAGRITIHRIMGAVILYLYIGLIFASGYRMAASLLHPGFSGLKGPARGNLGEMIYFSMCTLTTSGFGDIVPVHPFLRSLANLEAVIGQLYPATFLARLVTLHSAGAEREGS